ncbi:DUF4440 domain-containing protein [Candidatus Bathyarchaeota archaeon]|nr:DUF4440 domain-containing protein [Candidatus Bathyarchaeota archaeon]
MGGMKHLKSLLVLSMLPFLLVSTHIFLVNAESYGDEYAARKVIWNYVKAMNCRSVEEILSLYTVDGEFIDMTFDIKFSGPDQLRKLYKDIFNMNPRLTFTAFPWEIHVSGNQASLTCSWTLVGEYGVYNGVYLLTMSWSGAAWRILKITAYITVIHYYHPPNILIR